MVADKDQLPAKQDMDRALISEIAKDIGKEAVSHLRVMYPAAFKALGSSGQISLRNKVHNEIMVSLDTINADEIAHRLDVRKKRRRRTHKEWDGIRLETSND